MKKKKSKTTEEKADQEVKQPENQEETKQSEATGECCKEQIELMADKYLRLLAEFENFKKRTFKEKEELYKTASSKVITAILPVLDDIDRALSSVSESKETKPLIEGFDLISKKFKGILKQYGLEPIVSLEQDFDTDYHEALTIVETEDEKKGKVIDEIEKGYLLNGHVIRFAKVVVGK
jgi:molecular chaperone GrpE